MAKFYIRRCHYPELVERLKEHAKKNGTSCEFENELARVGGLVHVDGVQLSLMYQTLKGQDIVALHNEPKEWVFVDVLRAFVTQDCHITIRFDDKLLFEVRYEVQHGQGGVKAVLDRRRWVLKAQHAEKYRQLSWLLTVNGPLEGAQLYSSSERVGPPPGAHYVEVDEHRKPIVVDPRMVRLEELEKKYRAAEQAAEKAALVMNATRAEIEKLKGD